jgi:gluconokinase
MAMAGCARLAIIVMGVSGAGKSTLGVRLAAEMSAPFLEGDDFHPPANIRKMAGGIALDDADRLTWLDALASAVTAGRTDKGIVASCSALKRSYRDRLRRDLETPLLFVCLIAERATLAARMTSRKGHFMPDTLLDSQLQTLEMPGFDEPAIVLQSSQPIDNMIAALSQKLGDHEADRKPRN